MELDDVSSLNQQEREKALKRAKVLNMDKTAVENAIICLDRVQLTEPPKHISDTFSIFHTLSCYVNDVCHAYDEMSKSLACALLLIMDPEDLEFIDSISTSSRKIMPEHIEKTVTELLQIIKRTYPEMFIPDEKETYSVTSIPDEREIKIPCSSFYPIVQFLETYLHIYATSPNLAYYSRNTTFFKLVYALESIEIIRDKCGELRMPKQIPVSVSIPENTKKISGMYRKEVPNTLFMPYAPYSNILEILRYFACLSDPQLFEELDKLIKTREVQYEDMIYYWENEFKSGQVFYAYAERFPGHHICGMYLYMELCNAKRNCNNEYELDTKDFTCFIDEYM